VLASVLRTAKQQDKDAFALLVDLLRSAEPKLLDILPAEVPIRQPRSQACSEHSQQFRKSFGHQRLFPSCRQSMV
jgi:hypothetical protein